MSQPGDPMKPERDTGTHPVSFVTKGITRAVVFDLGLLSTNSGI